MLNIPYLHFNEMHNFNDFNYRKSKCRLYIYINPHILMENESRLIRLLGGGGGEFSFKTVIHA
jgi:hypothetical protein